MSTLRSGARSLLQKHALEVEQDHRPLKKRALVSSNTVNTHTKSVQSIATNTKTIQPIATKIPTTTIPKKKKSKSMGIVSYSHITSKVDSRLPKRDSLNDSGMMIDGLDVADISIDENIRPVVTTRQETKLVSVKRNSSRLDTVKRDEASLSTKKVLARNPLKVVSNQTVHGSLTCSESGKIVPKRNAHVTLTSSDPSKSALKRNADNSMKPILNQNERVGVVGIDKKVTTRSVPNPEFSLNSSTIVSVTRSISRPTSTTIPLTRSVKHITNEPVKAVTVKVPSTPKSKIQEAFNLSFTSIKNPFLTKPRSLPYFDPLLVEEYDQEIYEHWRMLELELRVDPQYMSRQPELDWSMRNVLVDWIFQLHTQFKMHPETLHLTLHLLDRTMSLKQISINKLQLVGVTALMIASKFEEILAPSVHDLSYFTDHAYPPHEIINAERYMLGILTYQIAYPSPLQFLKRMIQTTDIRVWNLSCYFVDVMLTGYQFLKYPPSFIASAALFLTIKVLFDGDWVPIINQTPTSRIIGYTEADLLDCVYSLLEYLKTKEIKTVYEKYQSDKWGNVSTNMLMFMKQKNMI